MIFYVVVLNFVILNKTNFLYYNIYLKACLFVLLIFLHPKKMYLFALFSQIFSLYNVYNNLFWINAGGVCTFLFKRYCRAGCVVYVSFMYHTPWINTFSSFIKKTSEIPHVSCRLRYFKCWNNCKTKLVPAWPKLFE